MSVPLSVPSWYSIIIAAMGVILVHRQLICPPYDLIGENEDFFQPAQLESYKQMMMEEL